MWGRRGRWRIFFFLNEVPLQLCCQSTVHHQSGTQNNSTLFSNVYARRFFCREQNYCIHACLHAHTHTWTHIFHSPSFFRSKSPCLLSIQYTILYLSVNTFFSSRQFTSRRVVNFSCHELADPLLLKWPAVVPKCHYMRSLPQQWPQMSLMDTQQHKQPADPFPFP